MFLGIPALYSSSQCFWVSYGHTSLTLLARIGATTLNTKAVLLWACNQVGFIGMMHTPSLAYSNPIRSLLSLAPQ